MTLEGKVALSNQGIGQGIVLRLAEAGADVVMFVQQHLLATNRPGKIINIRSTHQDLPFPNFTAYCVSQDGPKMLTRNLAAELGPLGITINNVVPGAIETPIDPPLLNKLEKLGALLKNIPLGRLGQPRAVSSLIAFLASIEADYITGSAFFVDGGLLWNYQEQSVRLGIIPISKTLWQPL